MRRARARGTHQYNFVAAKPNIRILQIFDIMVMDAF